MVEGARRGDPSASTALAQRLTSIPRIVAALNARFGSPLDHHEVADVSQDVALLVLRKLATFDGTSKLETWFYGMARLELVQAARRKSRRTADSTLDEQTAEPSSPEEHDVEGVHLALERLRGKDAAVVRLHCFERLTLDAAASRLGLPASSARRCYYRAIDFLRAHLARSARGS